MREKYRLAFLAMVLLILAALAVKFLLHSNIAVLNPKGTIGSQEQRLIIISTLLMLLVVIPVFIMTFTIAWKYREGNTAAKYMPDWDHHPLAEFSWWALPTLIILVLSAVAWRSSHQLDPYRPIYSSVDPVNIQVVALQWKWLFIYPDQNIASVNYVRFPVSTPINFSITADAPMNSFWIPQLGGQIYAMSGMSTKLHLMASQTGSFNGSSANISGRGFANMSFIATSTSQADFDKWVGSVQSLPNQLSVDEYLKLAKPSDARLNLYSSSDPGLYNKIIMKFMMPGYRLQEMDSSIAGQAMPAAPHTNSMDGQ